jgi:hypothetical protein
MGDHGTESHGPQVHSQSTSSQAAAPPDLALNRKKETSTTRCAFARGQSSDMDGKTTASGIDRVVKQGRRDDMTDDYQNVSIDFRIAGLS